MDARELAETISEGVNRLVWLIDHDACDEETKADIERLVRALDALKTSTDVETPFRPSQELFDDLRVIREHLESRHLASGQRLVLLRRAMAALGFPLQ